MEKVTILPILYIISPWHTQRPAGLGEYAHVVRNCLTPHGPAHAAGLSSSLLCLQLTMVSETRLLFEAVAIFRRRLCIVDNEAVIIKGSCTQYRPSVTSLEFFSIDIKDSKIWKEPIDSDDNVI